MILPDVNHLQRKFVDDFFLEAACLRVVSVGNAKYEISANLPRDREAFIIVSTAQKGRISTSFETGHKAIAQLTTTL